MTSNFHGCHVTEFAYTAELQTHSKFFLMKWGPDWKIGIVSIVDSIFFKITVGPLLPRPPVIRLSLCNVNCLYFLHFHLRYCSKQNKMLTFLQVLFHSISILYHQFVTNISQ